MKMLCVFFICPSSAGIICPAALDGYPVYRIQHRRKKLNTGWSFSLPKEENRLVQSSIIPLIPHFTNLYSYFNTLYNIIIVNSNI